MREVVWDNAGGEATLISVGGSFRNYLADHSEIAIEHDDEELREFHDRAMAALTVEGAAIEGFEMRGDCGRLGIRCAADTPPLNAVLQPELRTVTGQEVLLAPGLRRFSDTATLCGEARLASEDTLHALASASALVQGDYWTVRGRLWRRNEATRTRASARATARVVCVASTD